MRRRARTDLYGGDQWSSLPRQLQCCARKVAFTKTSSTARMGEVNLPKSSSPERYANHLSEMPTTRPYEVPSIVDECLGDLSLIERLLPVLGKFMGPSDLR